MSRIGPIWVRVVLSVIVVVLLFWPFAHYLWTVERIAAGSAATGGNPVYILIPVGGLFEWVTDLTWRFAFGLAEAVFASFAAIVIYTALMWLRGPAYPNESLCRRCGSVLRRLKRPECPTCGEPI